MEKIGITHVLKISESGYNEFWLRDMIHHDPSILGLGDLQAVMKEMSQPQGGRLDLLLRDPSDDSFYEVEIQLGATDESHIVRTIEYWDNNKKLWPKRSHTAVLVAEEITSRFFNVVHLLSMAVPIIGIQVNLVKVGETTALHFTKVLDSYEEPEDEEPSQQGYDEKHWVDNYPGALECARWYRGILTESYGDIPIKYFEAYISLAVGEVARVWIYKRKNDRALVEVKYAEGDIAQAIDYLTSEGVTQGTRDNKFLSFNNVTLQQLKDKQTAHRWIVQKLAPRYLKDAKA